jgi:hypothetical protein
MKLEKVVPWGRTYRDYLSMFDLRSMLEEKGLTALQDNGSTILSVVLMVPHRLTAKLPFEALR